MKTERYTIYIFIYPYICEQEYNINIVYKTWKPLTVYSITIIILLVYMIKNND